MVYESTDELTMVDNKGNYKCHMYLKQHELLYARSNRRKNLLGRRSYEFKEKIPKILKDKLIQDINKFNKKNEWGRWSEINKILKRKVGEKPGLWIEKRKSILGVS